MLSSPLAPPALYLATATAVAWLCHRCVQPLGRRWALALVLLPLCFTGRALLTGSAYGPIESAYQAQPFAAVAAERGVAGKPQAILHDLYTMILPSQQAARHAWSAGEWPLWNPFILCGQPLAGSGQPAPFYPPNLLSLALAPALAPGYLASLHFFLAALGGFLLARELGCRPATAIFAAVGWMGMNGTAFWIGWPLGASMLLLPLVWLATRRLVRQPGGPSCLLLVAVLALDVLAGHPETVAHHLWVGVGIGLWELARRPRREWPRILAWTAAAGGLTVGLSAIFLLPLADALMQTREWMLRGHPALLSETSWGEAAKRLLAHATPLVESFPPRALPGPSRFYSFLTGPYAGSVLLAPAVYGLLHWRRGERWLLATLAAIGLIAGIRTPVVYSLLDALPLLDRSINDRLIAVTGLVLALLAALGLEAWCARGRPRRLGWIAAGLLLPMAAASALLWQPLVAYGERIGGDPTAAALATRIAMWLAPALLALPFLLLRRGRSRALVAMLVLLIGQRVIEIGGYYPTAPAANFYPPVAPLDVEFPGDKIFRVTAAGNTLLPAQGVYYGLEDIRGYDAVYHLRYHRLMELWTDDPPIWFNRLADLDNPLLSLLNVRWVLVPNRQRPPAGWRLTRRGPTTSLWRNPDVLERAFVPDRVRFVDHPRQIFEQMRGHRDFSALAWIEPAGRWPPPQDSPNGPGTVSLTRDGLGYRLAATMERPGWVVISDVAWRGWRARSEGRELPLGVADYAFLALELPAGRHEVELYFRPRSFEAGLAISAATGAALLLALAVARHRRRTPTKRSQRPAR